MWLAAAAHDFIRSTFYIHVLDNGNSSVLQLELRTVVIHKSLHIYWKGRYFNDG